MSYLGQQLGQGQAERFIFTASGGETSVTTADDGRAIAYTVGQVDVYLNGAKLINGSDFTANTGTSITGLSALTASDVVEVFALSIFQASDTVSAASGGTFNGNVTVDANLTVTGTVDLNGGNIDGTVIGGATPAAGSFTTGQFGTSLNVDGTVTADGLTVDGVSNLNGVAQVGGSTDLLYLSGKTGTHAYVSLGASNTAADFFIGADTAIPLIFRTSATERMRITSAGNVGIGTSSPSALMHVEAADGAAGGAIKYTASGVASGYMSADAAGLCLATDTAGITFRTGITGNDPTDTGTERMRIDSSGNVGIGVVPSAWSVLKGFQVGTASTTYDSNDLYFGTNFYYGGAGFNYINSDFACMYAQVDGSHRWSTAASGTAGNAISFSEAMRLDSAGNLAINTTSTGGFKARINPFGSTDAGLVIGGYTNQEMLKLDSQQSQAGSSGVVFYRNSSFIGNITWNSTAVAYNTTSDARLKENIADAEDAGAKVDAIQVRQFDWKADGSHQDYGMIAQELMTVFPEAVNGDPESDDMMGVDYSKLVPMMLKEIQSLRARVAQLEGA